MPKRNRFVGLAIILGAIAVALVLMSVADGSTQSKKVLVRAATHHATTTVVSSSTSSTSSTSSSTSTSTTSTTSTTVVVNLIPATSVTAPPATFPPQPVAQPPAVSGAGACGGNLPPCFVCMRESHCTYGIVSKSLGCTGYVCYGKWQFDPRTWTNYARQLGFPTLCDQVGNGQCIGYSPGRWSQVTPAMEDAVAAAGWNGGQGCGAWNAC